MTLRFLPWAAVLAVTLAACSDAAESTTDAAAAADTAATAAAAPAAGEAMDPARDAAEAPKGPLTTMTVASYEHDFGTIKEGETVTHVFTFTNTGSEPLIIQQCKGSCGCTVPQCPTQPIPPGGKGSIEVKFNSAGKKNAQTKQVTIDANTDPFQTKLTIKANVLPADGAAAK